LVFVTLLFTKKTLKRKIQTDKIIYTGMPRYNEKLNKEFNIFRGFKNFFKLHYIDPYFSQNKGKEVAAEIIMEYEHFPKENPHLVNL
jgi:hypothetical protein